jgi:hypothetical protein
MAGGIGLTHIGIPAASMALLVAKGAAVGHHCLVSKNKDVALLVYQNKVSES